MRVNVFWFGVLCFCGTFVNGHAQQLDMQAIVEARQASNAALKAFDDPAYYQFLTDDVLITTGNGTLITGKKALMEYGAPGNGPRMYWIRTPHDLEINTQRGLAWESGRWEGFVEGEDQSSISGKYSAQWTKEQGKWLIRSQLFVTLTEQ